MTKNSSTVRGIIFAGCSFTWGQGLYYYSNLPTLKKIEINKYYPELVTASQVKYTETLRFPRLVANHFKTFEWVHPFNGGSHKSIIQWWKTSLDTSIESPTQVDNTPVSKISNKEVSHIVFQLTQSHRCPMLDLGYTDLVAFGDAYTPSNRIFFEKWLKNQNIDFDSYENYYIEYSLNTVKEFLIECENQGLKTLIVNWPKSNNYFIKKDKWFSDRFCTLEYENKIYHDMDTLIEDYPFMSIQHDYENFIDPPKDMHPSKRCHEVIAQNIIKHLKYE